MRNLRKRSFKLIFLSFIFGFFILNCLFFVLLQYPNGFGLMEPDYLTNSDPNAIDIVYTWVNGSDEQLIKELAYYRANLYLDKRFDSSTDMSKLHCPFEPCGFNDHFLISSSRPHILMDHHNQRFIASIQNVLQTMLNTSSPSSFVLIGQVKKSPHSRRSGIIFQSLDSISNLFINQSEFNLTLPEHNDDQFTISQIYIAATDDRMGYPIDDHVFLSELPEMRDASSEDGYRKTILGLMPNGSKLIKASATSFLIKLPQQMNIDQLNKTVNISSIGDNILLSRSVLILDVGLVTVLADLTESRYQDNDELRYSLRSVSKHARFFRHIFIVTNGQIPSWLDTSHPSITIVSHRDIFPDHSNLPTFNSAAIEAHLHNIPGLAAHFVYLNDDVFFGRTVYSDDFYSPSSGYKVYLGWSVPNCVEGCPSSWLADGFCDHDCNVPECQWDSGDCVKTGGRSGMVNFVQLANNTVNHQNLMRSAMEQSDGGFCNERCNSLWLADRYCDQNCNVENCGFDLGDCGDVDLIKLPSGCVREESGQSIVVANGTRAFVIKLKDVIGSNDYVTKASIDDAKEILASSYAIKYRIVVLVFHTKSSCKDCYSELDQHIRINLTVARAANTSVNILFHLVLNARHSLPVGESTRIPATSSITSTLASSTRTTFIQYEPFMNLSLPYHPKNENISINELEWQRPLEMTRLRLLLHDGLISLDGYHHLINELWCSLLHNNQTDIRLSAPNEAIVLDKLQWGFLPWENSMRSSNKWLNQLSSASISSTTMRHPMDLYAESLRYSNRIMTNIYNASQRRVPAHGPHFISTSIFRQAQQRFAPFWTRTATHRFRSPNDVQFAFTYFYYLMSENATIPLIDIFHSVDSDQSGYLNSNEIRSLILKLHPNETLSLSFIDQTIHDIRSSCGPSNFNSSTFQIDISELASCFNWTVWTQPKSMLRYPFTTHEDNDLAFIMISPSREKVLTNLDKLRKTSKKFFCLNDNLPNNGNMTAVATIREDVGNFLRYMFPTPSPFELVSTENRRPRWSVPLLSVTTLLFLSIIISFCLRKLPRFFRNESRLRRMFLIRFR